MRNRFGNGLVSSKGRAQFLFKASYRIIIVR
jgi:hypothetical protein